LALRPRIKEVVVTKRFLKDLREAEETETIVQEILDCSEVNFTELHKFEENVDGNLVFRAKKEDKHFVYCVDKNTRLIFLRVFKNFKEYGKFLEDKKTIINSVLRA
jgi:mRNA-degrading endonuclease RelE of RelBE toxin-antitoxin system